MQIAQSAAIRAGGGPGRAFAAMGSRRRRASLKNVAARAGFSVATVSRALNDTGYVAPETRKRILEAARELSYQPNLRARGLRKQSSHSIGLIIPNLLNAYYTALADALTQLLAGRGYHLILASTRDDAALEDVTVHEMVGQAVDGLIWVPTAPGPVLLEYVTERGVPAVAIVRRVPGDRVDTVIFEDLAGSRAATEHLMRLGHRRIGYIGGDIAFSSNRDRQSGYVEALKAAGLPLDEALVRLGPPRSTHGFLACGDLLRLPSPPTAIFVGSNALMPGVLHALRQSGLRLPEEMSLVCFDDIDWFSFSVPPITAVRTEENRLAESAVDLLFEHIEHREDLERPPVVIEIPFELVVRGSTAPPPAESRPVRAARGEPAPG